MEKEINIHSMAFHLAIGILLYTVFFTVAGVFFAADQWKFICGILLGTILSLLLMLDMYYSVQRTCGLDEKKADSYARGRMLLRALIVAIVVGAALYFSDLFDVIGLLLGMITLKLSAYTQPFLRRMTGKQKAGTHL